MNDQQANCSTCRFWGMDDGPHPDRVTVATGRRECVVLFDWIDGYEFDGVYTPPDFGCVRWEPHQEGASPDED